MAEERATDEIGEAAAAIRARVRSLAIANDVPTGPAFESASMRVERLPEFLRARCVRVSLHTRAYRLRLAALWAGKLLAVPRKGSPGLLLLDPAKIRRSQYHYAATEQGALDLGAEVDMSEAGAGELNIDLFVIGSAAANPKTGCRLAPSGLQEDDEYAALRRLGAVDASTPVVTTVHDFGLVEDLAARCGEVPVDILCTPRRTYRVRAPLPKPTGGEPRPATAAGRSGGRAAAQPV